MSETLKVDHDKYKLPDPSISEIIPGLYMGNDRVTWIPKILKEHNIKAIVSMIYAPWAMWSQKRFRDYAPPGRHLRIECVDPSTQDLLVHMERSCDFIEEMLRPIQQSTSAEPSVQSLEKQSETSETSEPLQFLISILEATEHLQSRHSVLKESEHTPSKTMYYYKYQ
jgi:hypothetical protein